MTFHNVKNFGFTYFLILVFVSSFCIGCGDSAASSTEETIPTSRFELVEKIDTRSFTRESGVLMQHVCIIKDRQTGVLYFASDHHLGGYQIHTPVLDENGKPIIKKTSDNKSK